MSAKEPAIQSMSGEATCVSHPCSDGMSIRRHFFWKTSLATVTAVIALGQPA